jgi:hypothetical protein
MGYCFRRFDVGGFDNQGRKRKNAVGVPQK